MQEHGTSEVIHQAAAHGHEAAHHEAHELPNFITVLKNAFPDAGWTHFLHQWENVIFSFLVAGLICWVAIRAASKKDIVPSGMQNFCEAVVEGIEGFVSGILGSHGRKHVPFLGTIFVYILLMNWSGLIPLMKSPSSAWSTTLAVALVTLVYVQVTGIREQGPVHYL